MLDDFSIVFRLRVREHSEEVKGGIRGCPLVHEVTGPSIGAYTVNLLLAWLTQLGHLSLHHQPKDKAHISTGGDLTYHYGIWSILPVQAPCSSLIGTEGGVEASQQRYNLLTTYLSQSEVNRPRPSIASINQFKPPSSLIPLCRPYQWPWCKPSQPT